MIEYRIVPSVSDLGEPLWSLYRNWSYPFGAGTALVAMNADRAVLERAIEHLKQ